MIKILRKLVNVSGVSGREGGISALIKELITPFCDEIKTDNLGNLIALKKGNSKSPKRIMLAAHMDEIGFITTFIDESGFIRFGTVGGINLVAAAYSQVVFESGVRGVIFPEGGLLPADFKANKFYVDIGAKNKKEAAKKVSVGDCFSLLPSLSKLSAKRFAGRPIDDRIGCALLVDIISKVNVCADDLYFVFTVQEEVGLRGARTSAYRIMPDYALAFDVTSTGDTPGADPMAVKLGGGAAIKIKDASVICDSTLVSLLQKTAQKNKIPYQNEILSAGGTDTAAMQLAGAGCAAGALSVPTRYIHSAVETFDLADAKACSELAIALLKQGFDNQE